MYVHVNLHIRIHICMHHIYTQIHVHAQKLKKSDIVLSIISNHYNMNVEINKEKHFRKFTDIKG